MGQAPARGRNECLRRPCQYCARLARHPQYDPGRTRGAVGLWSVGAERDRNRLDVGGPVGRRGHVQDGLVGFDGYRPSDERATSLLCGREGFQLRSDTGAGLEADFEGTSGASRGRCGAVGEFSPPQHPLLPVIGPKGARDRQRDGSGQVLKHVMVRHASSIDVEAWFNARVASVTISELSARTGKATSALRFYERRGLLASTGRTSRGRIYDEQAAVQVALVDLLRQVGFSLTEITGLIGPRGAFRPHWRKAVTRKLAELDQQQVLIDRTRATLQHALGCPHPRLDDCPVYHAHLGVHARAMAQGPTPT